MRVFGTEEEVDLGIGINTSAQFKGPRSGVLDRVWALKSGPELERCNPTVEEVFRYNLYLNVITVTAQFEN